jgi:hypothetical protein
MDRLEYKAYYGSIEYENRRLHGKVLGMTKDVILYEGNTRKHNGNGNKKDK